MSEAPERVRVFFALWPDAATADALAALTELAAPPSARRMRPDTLHMTLAFVGDIETARLPAVLSAGDAVAWPSFDMTVDRLALWSHNHILWAGLSHVPDALVDLSDALGHALNARGIALPDRPFKPHVTLARKADSLAGSGAIEPIDWHVDGGVLVRSMRTASGACYRVLKQWGSAG